MRQSRFSETEMDSVTEQFREGDSPSVHGRSRSIVPEEPESRREGKGSRVRVARAPLREDTVALCA